MMTAAPLVADDWESVVEPEIVVPSRSSGVKLEQKNMWEALEAAE
jgi:hypothetical protein